MTENQQFARTAAEEINKIMRLVMLYEKGTMDGPDGFEKALSEQDISDLKAKFVTAKAACIAALNSISG